MGYLNRKFSEIQPESLRSAQPDSVTSSAQCFIVLQEEPIARNPVVGRAVTDRRLLDEKVNSLDGCG